MRPSGRLVLVRLAAQLVAHVYSPDDQHLALGFNLPDGLGHKPSVARRDLARFQRAA